MGNRDRRVDRGGGVGGALTLCHSVIDRQCLSRTVSGQSEEVTEHSQGLRGKRTSADVFQMTTNVPRLRISPNFKKVMSKKPPGMQAAISECVNQLRRILVIRGLQTHKIRGRQVFSRSMQVRLIASLSSGMAVRSSCEIIATTQS